MSAPVIWLWFAGRDLDGGWKTNATWLHDATRVLHVTGNATRWARMRHWRRSAIRNGTLVTVTAVAWDLRYHFVDTVAILAVLAILVGTHGTYRGVSALRWWKHNRTYVRPLHYALTAGIGVPPSALEVAPARDRVTVGLPHGFVGTDGERQAIMRAITVKLAIEAPDADWSNLHGTKPRAVFTHSDPPPSRVTWGDVAAAVDGVTDDDLVVGKGKQGKIVTASLKGDSPHLGIAMGTGGGKSNLVAFWLAQRLRRGDIAYILDGKNFSHPWAFKDMAAEYAQLPNVGYARRVSDLHDAMVWLGGELKRRNDVAERAVNAKGDILANVGSRLFIVAEELNITTPLLKDYWAAERVKGQPKRSPALQGLADVAFAGRAVKMHLILIGQRLDAELLGASPGQGGAVRGNIGVRALARYDDRSWRMQAGDIPMPPSPSVPGRIQCWVSGTVTETQVPLMDFEQVRQLAIGGTVTPCPAGMPGIAQGGYPALPPVSVLDASASYVASDQAESYETPDMLTLSEAHRQGIFGQQRLDTIQRYSTRPGFPESCGWKGNAKLYRQADLYAYQAGKELVR